MKRGFGHPSFYRHNELHSCKHGWIGDQKAELRAMENYSQALDLNQGTAYLCPDGFQNFCELVCLILPSSPFKYTSIHMVILATLYYVCIGRYCQVFSL